MKIHMRPPLPPLLPAPPPKPPPTAFQLDMQTEELAKVAQQQKDRLKKLYGGQKNPGDLDEDTDSETQERDHRSISSLELAVASKTKYPLNLMWQRGQ
jgi:hypothetical protein